MVRRPTIRSSSAMRPSSWLRCSPPWKRVSRAFEGDVLPAGDQLGLQLVLSGDLRLALQAGEHFENDLGFELGGEGSASARMGMGGHSWEGRC